MTLASRDLENAARAIAGASGVWVGTHLDPDGDAVGSLLGLGFILRHVGKRVVMACQDVPPPDVSFLPGLGDIVAQSPGEEDLIVAVDVADVRRLGTLVDADTWDKRPSIVIDHHVTNSQFGTINLVDPEAASTAELVVQLADQLGAPIDEQAATCLLTGIVTDTIGFRTPNTRPETLDRARRLMAQGAPLSRITQGVFCAKPVSALRLLARAVDRLVIDGRFAVTTLRLCDFAEFGMPSTAVRGITEQLATAREPLVIALVREREDGTVEVSFRAKPGVDVAPAAKALRGGGHAQAAGARWPADLDSGTEAVWRALRDHVRLPDTEAGGP